VTFHTSFRSLSLSSGFAASMNTILFQKNSVTFTSLYSELAPKMAMPPWFEDFPLLCYFQSDAYAHPESNSHWSKLCRPVLCIVFSENTSWYVIPVDEEKRLASIQESIEMQVFFYVFSVFFEKISRDVTLFFRSSQEGHFKPSHLILLGLPITFSTSPRMS